MKVVIQRVNNAEVKTANGKISSMGKGLLCLVGIDRNDVPEDAAFLAGKTAGLRIFEDSCGKMNLNVKQAGGGILSVPQFTLLGFLKKGNRPSFDAAAPPEKARGLWEQYNSFLISENLPLHRGAFGEHMEVKLTNCGPVTIILESGGSSREH